MLKLIVYFAVWYRFERIWKVDQWAIDQAEIVRSAR